MAEEPNKMLYRKFVENVINEGRFEMVDDLFSPEYLDHSAPPGAPGGLDGVRAVFSMFRTAFPDVHFHIDHMVEQGDLVGTRVTGTGTHDGPFMHLSPTGRSVTWESFGIFRVHNDKIVEHWGQPDLFGLMQQLGAIPS